MKVAQLYTYPIKSLRPHALQEAQLTRHGFQYDRRFMLLQVLKGDDGTITRKNMHLSGYSEMVLFFTELHAPSTPDARDGSITVTYRPPDNVPSSVEVPLQPTIDSLAMMDVEMHGSSTKAYDMGPKYNEWFSARFGFEVVLSYLGEHHRAVLMSTAPKVQSKSSSWMNSVSDVTAALFGGKSDDGKEITFADCAPYLVVSQRSMDDVHNRLPEGQQMDVTKFRPNIVVEGAASPWEEDYWGEITINGRSKIECCHNCGRCVSINIDYATGKPGTGAGGKMLAKLQKDRRIDSGAKYSPVFGRYSFLDPSSEGHSIKIGDEVAVTRVNQEKSRFDWEGLCT